MSRYEFVLLNPGLPIDELVAKISQLGYTFARIDEHRTFRIDDNARAVLEEADYLDDFGMRLSQYEYVTRVWAMDRDVAHQEGAARRLYERLAEATPWALLLAYDDAQEFGAERPALAESA